MHRKQSLITAAGYTTTAIVNTYERTFTKGTYLMKPLWKSRTLWVSLISAVAAFFPAVQLFIQASPEAYALILSGVFGALRVISKDKLSVE